MYINYGNNEQFVPVNSDNYILGNYILLDP